MQRQRNNTLRHALILRIVTILLTLGPALLMAQSGGETNPDNRPRINPNIIPPRQPKPRQELTTLTPTPHELKTHFNQNIHRPRVVALFSPTCGQCVKLARTLQRAINKGFAGSDFSVMIVWTKIYEDDNENNTQSSTAIVSDPRARHFYDEKQLASRAFARDLVSPPPAVNLVLFYKPGKTWNEQPPPPDEWLHQITEGRDVDPDHYSAPDELADGLKSAMTKILPPRSDR